MNAHDGGIQTRWFPEPQSVAERYHAEMADREQRARESRARLDRQIAERKAAVAEAERMVREAQDGR